MVNYIEHYGLLRQKVANGRYGKEIDVYALGIILFEMLTGRVPFEGESVGEVLMKHLTAKPNLSGLAEPYRSVVAQALEKDPAKRFRSVQEMASRLPQAKPRSSDAGGAPAAIGPDLSRLGGEAVKADFCDAPKPLCEGGFVAAEAVEEEPLQQAVMQFTAKIRDLWQKQPTAARIAIAVVAVFAFLTSAEIVVPIGVVALIAYGGYRVVWSLTHPGQKTRPQMVAQNAGGNGQPQRGDNLAAGQPLGHAARYEEAAAARRARRRFVRPMKPREKALQALIVKPAGVRLADLLGSMLMAALVAMTICLVTVIVNTFRAEVPRPEQCAWLLLVGIAGSWGVMIPSKFWEGTQGEAMLRRFVLLIVGLALGLFAWGANELLLVELPHDTNFPAAHDLRMPDNFYNNGPQLFAFLAVFATLLVLVRWWRQSDPLRSARVSLWSLFITSALAGVVAWAWHFPQPWLIMVACTMSAAVQMSSPWLDPRKPAAENGLKDVV